MRSILYRLLRLYWRIWKPIVLGARVIVVRGEQVLLVRLSYAKGWYLPGGGVARGESFRQGAARELREECAIEAHELRLHGLYRSTKEGKIDQVAVYVVNDFKEIPGATADPEIREMRFFPFRDLPPEATPVTRRRIQEYLQNSADGVDQW